MTQTQHTPGIWHQGNMTQSVYVFDKDGRCIANCDTRKSNAEMVANGRLIAVAPEMLAALEKVLPLLEGFDDADQPEDGEEPIVAPVIATVRAAIAKAGAVA